MASMLAILTHVALVSLVASASSLHLVPVLLIVVLTAALFLVLSKKM